MCLKALNPTAVHICTKCTGWLWLSVLFWTNQSLSIHLLFFSTETITDITMAIEPTCSLPLSHEFLTPPPLSHASNRELLSVYSHTRSLSAWPQLPLSAG